MNSIPVFFMHSILVFVFCVYLMSIFTVHVISLYACNFFVFSQLGIANVSLLSDCLFQILLHPQWLRFATAFISTALISTVKFRANVTHGRSHFNWCACFFHVKTEKCFRSVLRIAFWVLFWGCQMCQNISFALVLICILLFQFMYVMMASVV